MKIIISAESAIDLPKELLEKYNEDYFTSEDYDLWSRCIEKVRLYN